ncbi:hypothetical protein J2X90_000699 [Variovorax paradoxus]|uniref:portal protein n=1 Tax=Variovorax paradoxus TaxID=34073 RepID=UPI002789D1AD|nr:portal protein [Variovorax paradoxus]MDQ0022913.1 hypothetical protein [Variovorax paradoxus]
MTISKEERLQKIHAEATAEFDKIQATLRDERLQCLQDRRFYSIAGAQWEGPIGDQFENKPKFEMNKIHLSVIRIINEYRNNRITVKFTPKDGSTNAKMADVCDGLYRADEQDSTADEAYDNAFEEAVGGGFGAWRLRTCYEDEEDDDNDKQRIVIEPIFDADSSVFFDLDAKRQDKADAKRCYVLTSMSPAAYKDTYGDDPSTWPKAIHQLEFDWATADVVYVCELYKVEETTELIHVFRGLDDEDMTVPDKELQDDPEKLDTLLATGFREVRQKRMKRRRVHKYLLSGAKVLEDEGYISGRCIPIIPNYGKRWFVDNVERCMGHVRLAKDAQRLKNMQVSNLGLLAAQSPREKPIFTPEQMAGHAMTWAEDNIKDNPYLLVNALRDADGNQQAAGPIGYTKPPSVSPAMGALLQITEQDMQDMLGNQQAGEQLQPNMSGVAVELVQNRLDMQVFIYMSNLKKAMKRSGEVWLSMMKDIAVEEGRRMKSVDSQGEVSSVDLNVPAYNKETGEQFIENDLSEATFDVNAQVGPSSTSRRAATVRALTGMMQISQDPETLSVLGAMAMMNMEGEGIGDVRDFFRQKLIRAGAVKPTEEEAQQLQAEAQNAKPDPNSQYLMSAAQEAEAGAAEKRAQTVETIASAELKRAQTVKTLAEAGATRNEQEIASVQALQQVLAGQRSGGMAPPDPSAMF